MTEATGAPGSAAPAAVGVGETLARVRCSIGLSIEDVAQQTKFSVRLLETLEQGRVGELPGGVYARGMVRSYARLLKLDPEPLVERMAEAVPATPAIDEAVSFRKPLPFVDTARRVNLGYALIMLGALALIGVVLIEWPRERSGPAPVTFAPAPTPVTLPAQPAAASEPPAPVTSPLAAAASPGTATDAPPPAVETAPAAAASGARRVQLHFDGAAWVEVRGRDGKVLVADLHRAGTTRSVEGEAPFHVVIGNAQKVKLSYGERLIDLAPHTRLDVARLTLE